MEYSTPCVPDCKNRKAGCHSKCFKYLYYINNRPEKPKKQPTRASKYGVEIGKRCNSQSDAKRKEDNEFFLTRIKPHLTIDGVFKDILSI